MEHTTVTVKQLREMKNKEEYEVFDPRLNAWVDVKKSTLLEKGSPIGFAPISDPFNKITAISVYLDWIDKLITLVIPPKTLSLESAQQIVSQFENTYLFEKEEDMLTMFLSLIEDADILSGWNSEGYDIPYIVGRITRVLSKDDTRKLCLWNQLPKERRFEKYGAETFTFDLVGRVHLDYMQLYQKYTFEERHSYSLDSIGEYELDERKVSYDGSLDQLYNQDFHKFIAYNRQDVALLEKLDKKLRFIELANDLAHANTVTLPTTMGSVAMIDQAIINETHSLGYIVANKKHRKEDFQENEDGPSDTQAAGAYVATPKVGMHSYIGAIDINSLYPSAIRALNMAPETLIGQLRQTKTMAYITDKMAKKVKENGKLGPGESFAAAWDGLFGSLEYMAVMRQDPNTEIIIDWENGESHTTTADVVYDLIFKNNKPWILSANGTIFRSDKEGIIPGLLRKWYAERKQLQKKKKEATSVSNGIPVNTSLASNLINSSTFSQTIDIFDPSLLLSYINEEKINELQQYMNKFGLIVDNNIIKFKDYSNAKYWIYYYDKSQNIRKIQLNSTYGALLNVGCRFNDQRIGQSTTLSGRVIAKHMDSFVNECITGEYDHTGESIIYGDSVTGDSLIRTEQGTVTIEELFNSCKKHSTKNGKEYGCDINTKVVGFNIYTDEPILSPISFVIRHKTKKKLYRITTDTSSVKVTRDHSIMVDRGGFIFELKPTELQKNDLIIQYNEFGVTRHKAILIDPLPPSNEYVYDISVSGEDPVFFANNILVKNTDSVFFSAWPLIKDKVESGEVEWNRDICVQIYDDIAKQVNESFPIMMEQSFHCPRKNGEIIRGGRELVGSRGLFIKKKRYAVLIYDMEGVRYDLMDEETATKKGLHYKLGKVKAMGLDLKRSDTPKIVQTFLSEILLEVLQDTTKEIIFEKIKEFKKTFSALPAWEKGTPRRVNNLTMYSEKEKKEGSTNMPGHVRAAMNWNTLRRMHTDSYSMEIMDGMKIIVCSIRNNPMGFTSVAYPIDEERIPNWFKELPFDNELMEETIVDKKLENLLGVLNWVLAGQTQTKNTFNSLFSFE